MIREGVHINAVYQHYKGDYYRVLDIGFLEKDSSPMVIYQKSDINGIYQSIREYIDIQDIHGLHTEERIVKQPFLRPVKEFLETIGQQFGWGDVPGEIIKIGPSEQPRYKFIKQL